MSRTFKRIFIVILSVLLFSACPEFEAFADGEEEQIQIINECGFEDDSILSNHEWYAFGDTDPSGVASGVKAEIEYSGSHSGKGCIKVSNRSETWMGPGCKIFDFMEKRNTYQISVFAKHDHSQALNMNLVLKVIKGNTSKYDVIATANMVEPNEWVELSGEYFVPSGCSNIELYIDPGQTGCNEYADDFVIKKLVATTYVPKEPGDYGTPVVTWDFENNNLDTWKDNGISSLMFGNDPELGNYLKVRNGRAQKGGCSVSLQPYYDPSWKGNFYFTGYIYLAGTEDKAQTFIVSQITQNSNGMEKTDVIDKITIFPNEWIGFASELNLNDDTRTLSISITGPELASFYLNDVSFTTDAEITSSSDNNLQNVERFVSNFEKDNDLWVSKDGARLVRTDEFSKKGSYSLYVDSRESSKSGLSLLLDMLEKGVSYNYSCYIRYDGEEEAKTREFYIQAEILKEGKKVYNDIGHGVVKKGKWCKIKGTFTIPEKQKNVNCIISAANENIEDSNAISFYIDDIDICREDIYKSHELIKLLVCILLFAVFAVLVLLIIKKRYKSSEKIKNSKIDSMTKAYNRNTYEEVLKEYETHPEKCVGLYFAVCDLNHLKYINDNFGHSFGDDAIIRCASLLLRACSSSRENKVYRIGGDEFVVISVKNIRAEINMEIKIEKDIQKEYPFDVAVGYSTYNTIEDGEIPDISNIIKRADEEMYRIKQQMKKDDNIETTSESEEEKK